ncbi:MAG: hypothetical protein DME22_07370 [Verrucomicrobia bacterium]|nr:MAG: hypothetical protein DME22_07370 [Verrucomicrobiota bacterium]PYK02582.1 MAG: hypothetical protein DME23_01370 [Verrucomicrobiota bacterium]
MKKVTAILFSFLLAGAQSVFAANSLCAVAPAKARCACSHCDKPTCCAARSVPLSQQPVAPPSRDGSQNQLHLLPAIVAQLISLTAPSLAESVSSASPSLKVTDVPLYVRNCSYLV